MLSCWQQWDAAGVPGSALSQWLVKQNFDAQEAAALYQDAHLHTMEDLGDNGPQCHQPACTENSNL